jgi:H/ACA ribonucleoprotein complex subunit 1
VIEVATFSHECEGDLIAMLTTDKIPLLARMVYTENKQLIGKVDDVFGPMGCCGLCVKPDANSGIKASSFKKGDKVSSVVHLLLDTRGT